MRKKLAAALAILMTAAMALTACGGNPQGGTSSGASTDSSKGEGAASVPAVSSEPVTITMVGEGELITTLMAEKLKEKFPNITVEFKHPDGAGWVSNEMLLKWAAAGNLPDIIYLQNPAVIYQNNLVVDLKPYFEADPENGNFYKDVVQYSMINDKMLMLPYQISFFGIMVNKDLIASNNMTVPGYGWTVQEFSEISKKLYKPGSQLGTYNAVWWANLVPQYDDSLELGGYNRTQGKWVLDDAWQNAVQSLAELVQGGYTIGEQLDRIPTDADGSWTSWYAKSRELCGADDPWVLWQQGGVATWAEGSYWSKWDENNETYPGFDWDFYPIPVVNEGDVSRASIITDNYAISNSCKNPAEAYEVLKFFTYSKEGFEARYDIWKNYDAAALREKYPEMAAVEGTIPDTLSFNLSPVDDQGVRDKWAELYNPKPGLKNIIDNLSTSKPYADGFKVIPGWEEVMTNTVIPAVKDQVFTGEKTAADLAAELQPRVDSIQEEVFANMEKATS